MNRPCVEEILKPLKPFQRRTVDHAFHRLFVARDSTARFLVADEVGLGKTLVARGIIARAIDHLWDDVQRIDIVYICSNASIASANLPKLRIGGAGERSVALATRLTMLATELAPRGAEPGLVDSKLNFISFTPGTSFSMGHSTGQRRERKVLFHLLEPLMEGYATALMNLLQGQIVNRRNWRWRLRNVDVPIDPAIRERFETQLNRPSSLQLRRTLHELCDRWFHRYREHWPAEVKNQRNRVVADLRRLLARVCVEALEPDLVILDEFQRFKPLLETREDNQDTAVELAQTLFGARTPEGNQVRTLLLSATPYKLYTADAEIEHEDHYKDFLETTRFLLNGDETRVGDVQRRLACFGTALKRATVGEPGQVEAAKRAVEGSLQAIMARTERVAASVDRDAMVAEHRRSATLTPNDVRQYLAADALFRAVGDRDPMPLWKSAPYLAHFMQGYKVNERLDEALELSPDKVNKVFAQHKPAFLKAETLLEWSKLDPGNAKLRDMVSDLLDEGLWRLLWIPPTLPYWALEGPFKGKDTITKTLLFSAWNVVPDVVSAVLSYEAERRMVGKRGRIKSYQDPAKQQVPLLKLTQSASGARSRHRLLLLLMPCLALADRAHPLDAPPGQDRRDWTRKRVEELLDDPELPNPGDGEIDSRWEWAAPLLFDPALRTFLQAWRDDETLPRPNKEIFNAYIEDLLALTPSELGRRPPKLAELLTEVALGSPTILALRCLKVSKGTDDDTRRELAVTIADAFWSLFNQPAVISLIRQLAAETGASRDEPFYSSYWRLVLRYCQQGNLQAVLDEQWHLLWEQHAWSEETADAEIARECSKVIVQAVQPTRSRVHARFFPAWNEDRAGLREVRVRTVFALRFGASRTEEDGHISQDAVRVAFNSPFRPFVLSSTSIGQEGLDFHPWCHRLIHWNLPGNPVDLEQREGRVHRYKGHAVRRNVAAACSLDALCEADNIDIWTRLFQVAEKAARDAGNDDLVPCWIAPGKYRVERHVPIFPYTREVEAFERLKRQLAAYRVVFGQPRQEELVTLLNHANLDIIQLKDWAIDLSPPAAGISLPEQNQSAPDE